MSRSLPRFDRRRFPTSRWLAGARSALRAGLVVLALAGVAPDAAFAQAPAAGELPTPPRLNMAASKVRGQQAIDAIGSRLPEVAAAHGMTAARLEQLLRTDPSLWIDRNGRLLYIDEHLPPAPPKPKSGATAPAGASTPMSGTIPLSETFMLHSRPGASRTIYLDFNGHTVTGTAWNASYGIPTISAPAYDIDGVAGTFTDTELGNIQEIWRRVAEDYAPFDVDVTTEEPPADTLTRSSSGDTVFGVRVVVTRDFTASTATPCNCGGFAYLSVFDQVNNAYYQPAFVFCNQLGNGNPKYVAEAISHEAGHNLGLGHDGSPTTGYYSGQGSGATGWAPIMGVGYYRELVQWSKGEYSGANNLEDDLAVMQQRGAPLRTDDHGNQTTSATPMTSTASGGFQNLEANGVIERRADVDVFSFYAGPGTVTLTLAGAAPSSNLDASLTLLDAGGNPVVAMVNPPDALGATLTATLPATGQYFVVVDGVGKGDPTTAYSDYGSLGQYRITGTAPLLAGTPPVAVAAATPSSGTAPLAVTLSGAASYDPDGSIASYQWNFGDGTGGATGATVAHTYTAAGSYTATLTVVDNAGLAASKGVLVSVTPVVTTNPICVASIGLTLRTYRNGQADVVAAVKVADKSGNPLGGSSVTGAWSGLIGGSTTAQSGSTGVASLVSSRFKTSGTVNFKVSAVALSGYAWGGCDVVTSATITR